MDYDLGGKTWQPISTAPMRKRILLWSDWKGGWGDVEVGYVDPRYMGHPEYKYTLWRELPEPPKGKRNRKD